jgi:putative glutamine amidotransferase
VRPRIAIPVPHSGDPEYAARSLPQYTRATELAGGEAVLIPLDGTPKHIVTLTQSCQGILLPGSRADIDPARYHADRHAETAEVDLKREQADALLLEDAYKNRKPVLGICYGLQSLNVHRGGTLIQHIPEFLAPKHQVINHDAGRKVAVAHSVSLEPGSRLEEVVGESAQRSGFPVNSSHHQSVAVPGQALRVVGHCPEDDIVEALEGTDPDHFVLAVQWHPERSVADDEPSLKIFAALVDAAKKVTAK